MDAEAQVGIVGHPAEFAVDSAGPTVGGTDDDPVADSAFEGEMPLFVIDEGIWAEFDDEADLALELVLFADAVGQKNAGFGHLRTLVNGQDELIFGDFDAG